MWKWSFLAILVFLASCTSEKKEVAAEMKNLCAKVESFDWNKNGCNEYELRLMEFVTANLPKEGAGRKLYMDLLKITNDNTPNKYKEKFVSYLKKKGVEKMDCAKLEKVFDAIDSEHIPVGVVKPTFQSNAGPGCI